MRRATLLIGLILAVAAPAVALGSASKPTSVGVSEREWRLSLYRARVPAGVLKLNVHNYGEDGHDLAVRNRAGRVVAALGELRPDGNGTLRVRLGRGHYRVFCSLEGHEAKGMHARLTVVKRRSR